MDYDFFKQFEELGIKRNDAVLMHSSMKALQTSLAPEEFLKVLIDYLSEGGTLLLPSLSFEIQHKENPVFSVKETPACIGLLPNVFLKMDGVKRSVHPTHSCAGIGANAEFLLGSHYLDRTPIGENSPFRKLAELNGKILMVGDVNEHNTLMHGVEEIGGAPYCVSKTTMDFTIIGENGIPEKQSHYVHDFKTVKRLYYSSVEKLLSDDEISRGKIGSADCTLMSAKAILEKGVAKVRENPWYFADKKDDVK